MRAGETVTEADLCVRCKGGRKAWVLRSGDAICDPCHDESVVLWKIVMPMVKEWRHGR